MSKFHWQINPYWNDWALPVRIERLAGGKELYWTIQIGPFQILGSRS